MRRSTEVGVSDRIVLRCPAWGERTVLLRREEDWYGRGATIASGVRAGRGYAWRTALGTDSWTCRGCLAVGLRRTPSCFILTPLWAWGPP